MIIALITTFVAFVTAVIAVIAAKEVIWDEQKPGVNKLNGKGYVVIICATFMVFLPLVQYCFQNKEDEKKEAHQTAEEIKRENELRSDYEKSVVQIRKDFGDSNYRTLTVVGQTLAKYGLRLDTTEKRLTRLIHDSANMKTVLPDQPVLELIGPNNELGIQFLKFENGLNHYSIIFMSQDGGSCCYDIKISAVIADTATLPNNSFLLIYKGPVRMGLTQADQLAKGNAQPWTFSIDNKTIYNRLFLWVRGTYGDRNNSHTYHINKVYYNLKPSNTFGEMQGEIQKQIIELVNRIEK